jgi:hypothetical protein
MNDFWTTTIAVLLVTLGALAELNLLRIFLIDWREGRREQRRRTFRQSLEERAIAAAPARARVSRRAIAACVAAPALVGSVAHAQDTGTSEQASVTAAATEQPPPPAETAKSPFGLQLNLDFTNAYFYHGIRQQDQGLIVQPAAKLTVNLFEQDDLKIDALLGTWNSFGPNGGTQTSDLVRYWYESDLIGGFVITKDKLSLTTTYTFLTSPSDAYETVQELDFTVAFDDSDALGKWALHPYVLLGIETNADASDGGNSDPGTYLELGIAPGCSFDAGKTPVSITFPASVGLSLHDYYQNASGDDDTFGFAQVGVKASFPLPFGDRYGKWTLNAGVSAMFLGDHTTEFNGGQSEQVIGTIGLQLNF